MGLDNFPPNPRAEQYRIEGDLMEQFRNHYGDLCWQGEGIWMRLFFNGHCYELQCKIDDHWEYYVFTWFGEAQQFVKDLAE
jgi:hypothetical protein